MPAADEGSTSMILTVTVNAAVDKTLTVANLQLGHRHRAQQGLVMAGGKGVNVARALKRLGEPVIATGLVGGHNGARILDEMTAEGILNDFVRIRGESRTSTVVVDPTSDRKSTRLNSSHVEISYAVFCLKKKNHKISPNHSSKSVEVSFYHTTILDLRHISNMELY